MSNSNYTQYNIDNCKLLARERKRERVWKVRIKNRTMSTLTQHTHSLILSIMFQSLSIYENISCAAFSAACRCHSLYIDLTEFNHTNQFQSTKKDDINGTRTCCNAHIQNRDLLCMWSRITLKLRRTFFLCVCVCVTSTLLKKSNKAKSILFAADFSLVSFCRCYVNFLPRGFLFENIYRKFFKIHRKKETIEWFHCFVNIQIKFN